MLMNMGSSSLRIQYLPTALDPIRIHKIQVRYATTITCGLRKPLRTRRRSDGVLSTEAIQAVQSLKLAARNPSKLDQVFESKLTRLLKDDLLDTFAELQRQQHLDLALKVSGLKPNTRVYTELIGAYLKVEMIEKAMEAYKLMKASGCVPDELTLTIMIRNFESAGEEELASIIKNDCVEYLDSPKKFLKEVARKYPRRLRLNLV
ncbi:unnamed protein product [Lactuca saligna]|uniref:Pentacotripeptide-repeat region of PRORP domain-containing protein n=1 Tax=Lactuca saligna TaxID=75948 RepID=A0AA35YNQ9_LACSI|nr:unnamed protein product [Lactuca saligna]